MNTDGVAFRAYPDHPTSMAVASLLEIPRAWGVPRLTPQRVQNLVQVRLDHERGATVLEGLPIKLSIESTNICNLRCPACFTGAEREGRAKGHMPVELFAWLMQELGPTLFEVELHNWGEPLLGKNVVPCIEMVTAAGASSTISSNLSIPLDEKKAEALIAAGLTTLGVSLDGATQESYEKYRVRGNIDLVLKNCRLVLDAKKKLGSSTPEIWWAYHVFPHNVHEVETARKMAEDLGMRFSIDRGWLVGDADARTSAFPYHDEGAPAARCFFLWYQAVVHHDGGVAPCCGTFYQEDDFHRLALEPHALARTSFRSIWNSERFVQARRLFYGKTRGKEVEQLACFDCNAVDDFLRFKEAKLTGEPYVPSGSNAGFNFFWRRSPNDGPQLVSLKRKPSPSA